MSYVRCQIGVVDVCGKKRQHKCVWQFTLGLPYNNNDSVKNVVGVPQVVKGAEGCELEDHLQGKHAGKDDVADLQNVCQFLRLSSKKNKQN